jgi:hypothetical protein
MKGMILHETEKTVQIITFSSANIKTGDMSQVWILNKEVNPVKALKNGDSKEICFTCPHLINKTCYVNTGQAPLAVYKAYKLGKYIPLDLDLLKGFLKWKAVRFGAYGEPVLIPLHLVKFMAKNSRGFTGYTHQWNSLKYLNYRPFFMASTDSVQETKEANSMGWRSFRVKGKNDSNMKNEIDCPNTTTGIQCRDCQLCDGNNKKAKNISIDVHGTIGKINKFNLVNA